MLWIDNYAVVKLQQLFLYCSLDFFTKNFDSLFNTILGQDGIICDGVGWWSGSNKGGNRIYDVDIGLCNIVEGMGDNSQVYPAHGGPIGYSVIVVDGGKIL